MVSKVYSDDHATVLSTYSGVAMYPVSHTGRVSWEKRWAEHEAVVRNPVKAVYLY